MSTPTARTSAHRSRNENAEQFTATDGLQLQLTLSVMPTPKKFKYLSRALEPRKKLLWFFVFLSVFMILVSIYLIAQYKDTSLMKYPLSLGLIILICTWALICVESWFNEKGPRGIFKKIQTTFPNFYGSSKVIFEWYASIFLILWCFAGLLMSHMLLIKF